MKRRDLESAVAAATGEDVHEIRRRGFSLLNLRDRDFDPEPDNLRPQAIDWDRLDQQRHRSVFEQVFGPLQPAV